MSKLILSLADHEERVVTLPGGEAATIGRDAGHTVTLDDGTVSRLHARLTWREDGVCLLEDVHSANGTTLNGVPLARPEPLQDGDRLGFGSAEAIYLAADAPRPTAYEFCVGDRFAGRYRLDKSLGETDEYDTFLASDTAAGDKPVTVTIYLPEIIAGAGGFDEVRRRFAEFRAVPPHAGLVPLLDFTRWRGSDYLVSEWIENCPLLELLRQRGSLPLASALQLATRAADITDHARAHGWPAPDLSPRAVLLSADETFSPAGRVKILDAPAGGWPDLALKLIPRLFTVPGEPVWPLGTLLCELLGHPFTGQGAHPPARIVCLGERGNAVLARGFAAPHESPDSDGEFVAALTDVVGVHASKVPAPPVGGTAKA